MGSEKSHRFRGMLRIILNTSIFATMPGLFSLSFYPLSRLFLKHSTSIHVLIFQTVAFLLFSCTPPSSTTNIRQCPEPLWKEYSSLQPYQVKAEIDRLTALLAVGDTIVSDSCSISDSTDRMAYGNLSELEIRQRLFELSIHSANPVYDFEKISEYASFLYQHGGADSLRYRNWGRAAREYRAIVHQRDSLADILKEVSEEEKKASRTIETLKKGISSFQKQYDSLNAIISDQKETINKLQKLDVMMEQQRRRIQ